MATCEINASVPNKSALEETQCPEITVNFGIFFDGTNNQRLQVATGKLNRAKNADKQKEKIKKNIEKLGGTFDEARFKENGNIKYSFKGSPLPDKEKEIEKLNKKIAKYNKKYGNRLDDNERDTVESFSWDNASGEKNDNDNNQQALNERSGFRVGMSRSSMQGVDFTNIARLEPLYDFHQTGETIYTYRIYVSGSGTFADLDKGVDISGLAFGQGSAGVVQKVKDALEALKEKIKGIKNNSNIKEVNYKFNVFGFSRGATEARLFVDLLSNRRAGKRHEILDNIITEYNNTFIDDEDNSCISFPKLKSFEFPFVGVYDTVSSVGTTPGIWNGFIAPTLTKGGEAVSHAVSKYHEKNKEELGLDTLVYDGNVKHVVHICALDEFRENFSLQVMPINNSKIEQFFIPGIHTDIGGGDLDGYDEEKYIAKTHNRNILFLPKIVTPGKTQNKSALFVINKENLKELGWIKDSTDSPLMDDIVKEERDIIKIQRYSEHGYNYLPLTILAEKACENTCKFENLEDKYSIPDDLPQSFGQMEGVWAGADSKYGHCYYPTDNSKYRWLRQKYLHFSSNIKKTAVVVVNGPHLTKTGDEKPVYYYDRFLDFKEMENVVDEIEEDVEEDKNWSRDPVTGRIIPPAAGIIGTEGFDPKNAKNSNVKGNYGEIVADNFLQNNPLLKNEGYDFQRIGMDPPDLNSPGHQGIDGIYKNNNFPPPPRFLITEVKYNTSRLSTLTDGTRQMSFDWIIARLDEYLEGQTIKVGDEEIKLSKYIEGLMIDYPDEVGKVLINVDEDGNISKISQLDDDGKETKKIIDNNCFVY